MSVVEFSKKLGKSESAIRMWESGKNKPDADTLIELSKLFECTTDYLLGLSEDKSTVEYHNRLKKLWKFEEIINSIPLSERSYFADTLMDTIKTIFETEPSAFTIGNDTADALSMFSGIISDYRKFLNCAEDLFNTCDETAYLRFASYSYNFGRMHYKIILLLWAAIDNAKTAENRKKLCELVSRDFDIKFDNDKVKLITPKGVGMGQW